MFFFISFVAIYRCQEEHHFSATFLLAFENFTFVLSGMAFLVPRPACWTFMLAAFWLYLRGDYPGIGINVWLFRLKPNERGAGNYCYPSPRLIVRRDRIWQFGGLMLFCACLFRIFDAVNSSIYLSSGGSIP